MFNVEKLTDELLKSNESVIVKDIVKVSLKDDPNTFCMMPMHFVNNYLDKIKSMEVFEDDIWVVTFMKCGTTWTQEMIWMLNNNLDYKTATSVKLDDRFPFIELSGIFKDCPVNTFDMAVNAPRPRHIKSHLPLFLLPDALLTVKPKIVCVARNPKDSALSYFHHHRNIQGYQGSKENFIKGFCKDFLQYSPCNGHVLEFWKIRNQPNMLFLFFEDLKTNLEQQVKIAMKFLGKEYSQEQIDKLCEHLSFESIQKNPMVNKSDLVEIINRLYGDKVGIKNFNFIRKGQVGGYKAELTEEENQLLDQYTKDPKLAEAGFQYKMK